jgi:hypothetical protein
MTGPRPSSGAQPPAKRRPSTAGERRPSESARPRVEAASEPDWLVVNASRFRWATWIAVLVIAVRLIAPRPDGWHRWNDASTALSDVESARTSALMYYQAASHQWPQPGRAGIAPTAMLPYLPGGLSYARSRYRLTWEYAADTTSGTRIVGITVTGDDPRLALAIAERAPLGMPFVVSGGRFTALIASAVGR